MDFNYVLWFDWNQIELSWIIYAAITHHDLEITIM